MTLDLKFCIVTFSVIFGSHSIVTSPEIIGERWVLGVNLEFHFVTFSVIFSSHSIVTSQFIVEGNWGLGVGSL